MFKFPQTSQMKRKSENAENETNPPECQDEGRTTDNKSSKVTTHTLRLIYGTCENDLDQYYLGHRFLEKGGDSFVSAPNPLTVEFMRAIIEDTLEFDARENIIQINPKEPGRVIHLIESWLKEKNIKFTLQYGKIFILRDTEALDLLSILYDKSNPQHQNPILHSKYLSQYVHHANIDSFPELKVVLDDQNAILPSKIRASDVGFDLTIIKKFKDLGPNTALYDTGIRIQPPFGNYVEIVPRSSLSKSGYIQTNSVGIIDPNYLGTLKVPLTKIDASAPDLVFPFTGSQLIIRCYQHCVVRQVEAEELTSTSRDTGGFGSTSSMVTTRLQAW